MIINASNQLEISMPMQNGLLKNFDLMLKVKPNMSFTLMAAKISINYGVIPNEKQLCRARKRARDLNEGNHAAT